MTMPLTIHGMEVVTSLHLTETVQHSRSPSRAKRRARMGHRQCYRTIPSRTAYQSGNQIVMHPARFEALRKSIADEVRTFL